MKRFILVVFGLGALTAALAVYMILSKAPSPQPTDVTAESNSPQAITDAPTSAEVRPAKETARAPAESRPLASNPAPARDLRLAFNQAVETLGSARAGFDEKQDAWKRLIDAGKLDDTLRELEQRVADDPRSAEYACSLGQGYYKKAGQTEDIREKAILAMKADQTLEAALNLDPANWDARYIKAVGMSRWPDDLGKGQEVIAQFQLLIEQQETQTPRPEYARTYLRLGEQYVKAGHPERAADIWRRGAGLFPNSSELKQKVAPAQ